MKLLTTAVVAATLALAAPVAAGGLDDIALGFGVGTVESHSASGGVAATGGLAANGMDGFSSVQSLQGASNLSSVEGTLNFDPRHGMGDPRDGVTVFMEFETLSVSEQLSQTRVIDNGLGTAGLGGGIAASSGNAFGAGKTYFQGWDSW